MMIEEKIASQRTYRNNIDRYRELLKTELSALERQFIERRLNEEESAMERLATSTITLTFVIPDPITQPQAYPRQWTNLSTEIHRYGRPYPSRKKALHEVCP